MHTHAEFVAGLKYFACASLSWALVIDLKVFPVVTGVAVPPPSRLLLCVPQARRDGSQGVLGLPHARIQVSLGSKYAFIQKSISVSCTSNIRLWMVSN